MTKLAMRLRWNERRSIEASHDFEFAHTGVNPETEAWACVRSSGIFSIFAANDVSPELFSAVNNAVLGEFVS